MFMRKLRTARRRWLVIVAALALLAWPAGVLAADTKTEDGYQYFVTDSGTVIKRPVEGTKPKDHTTDSGTSTARPNSTSLDSLMITRLMLEQGKVDLANLDMTQSASSKSVFVEKAAMEYAAQQNMEIGMVTNYVTVRLPAASIVNSDYWKKAAASSRSFHFFFRVDDVKGIDLSREYRTSEQVRLGAWPVSQKTVELEMYLRGSDNTHTYIETLDSPDITIVYNYINNYRTVNSRYPQQTLAFVWCDTERKLKSMYTTNELLPTHTDIENQTMEIRTPYAFGCYLMVSQTNADNRKTQLANAAKPGQVNTSGVPAWAAADVGALQSVSVVLEDLSGKRFNEPISRGELAAYLANVLGLYNDGTALSNPFRDVAESSPYYEEILLAARAGLLSGRTADSFEPNAALTREELACLFTRALEKAGQSFSTDRSRLAAMRDADQVSAWAKDSAAACLNTGLIAGTDGNRFAPQQKTTWAEAVVMLNRLYNIVH